LLVAGPGWSKNAFPVMVVMRRHACQFIASGDHPAQLGATKRPVVVSGSALRAQGRYLGSGLMFVGLLALPGLAYRFLRANSVLASWTAYILTRPLGASFADYLGFSHGAGGVGLVHPAVAVIFPVPHRRAGRLPGRNHRDAAPAAT